MTDTRNPDDPRRFARAYPDDQERRFEELFARSQKVQDLPAQLALVDTRVVALEVSGPLLTARVVVLELSDPILKARVTALEADPDVVASNYTKFKNGTLICTGQISGVLSGGVIINDVFTFPVAFISTPKVTTGLIPRAAPNADVVTVMDLTSVSTTAVQARGRTWDTATSTYLTSEFICHVTAVGQWR